MHRKVLLRKHNNREGRPIYNAQNGIVATTLRYKEEVTDPSHFAEIRDLPEAGEDELDLMKK